MSNNFDVFTQSPTDFSRRGSESNDAPYWSPASQIPVAHDKRPQDDSTNLAISAPEFVPSLSSAGLTPKSAEFVPSWLKIKESSTSNDSAIPESMSGLNSLAVEWMPGFTKDNDSISGANTDEVEPTVEVTWRGQAFFVPLSQAYAYEGGGVDVPEDQQFSNADSAHMGVLGDGGGSSFGLEWNPGSITHPAPKKRSLQAFSISEPIRQHFRNLDLESLRQMDPDDERYKEIPSRFHSAFPLDDDQQSRSYRGTAAGSFGYPSAVYKVLARDDSQVYALRRFENVRSYNPTVLQIAMGKWAELRHPGIVQLHSISQAHGSLLFTHAYHPLAKTVKELFIDQGAGAMLVSEELVWWMLSQLISAIRAVHRLGIAVRCIHPSHILLTSGHIFRINSVGVADVLEFESRKSAGEWQADDLVKLAYLVLSVIARASVTAKNVAQAMSYLQQLSQFADGKLQGALSAMLSGKASTSQICALMAERIQDELDAAMANTDALHSHLRCEYENGRLLRLMLKLGFINERPDFALSPDWSETGDRYLLKLFRDFVFHQTLGVADDAEVNGAPVIDAGHVISSLNKLDAGDTERILLCSRDQNDLLILSYADVRNCLENAFVDLEGMATTAALRYKEQTGQDAPGPGVGAVAATESTVYGEHATYKRSDNEKMIGLAGSGYGRSLSYGQSQSASSHGRTHAGGSVGGHHPRTLHKIPIMRSAQPPSYGQTSLPYGPPAAPAITTVEAHVTGYGVTSWRQPQGRMGQGPLNMGAAGVPSLLSLSGSSSPQTQSSISAGGASTRASSRLPVEFVPTDSPVSGNSAYSRYSMQPPPLHGYESNVGVGVGGASSNALAQLDARHSGRYDLSSRGSLSTGALSQQAMSLQISSGDNGGSGALPSALSGYEIGFGQTHGQGGGTILAGALGQYGERISGDVSTSGGHNMSMKYNRGNIH